MLELSVYEINKDVPILTFAKGSYPFKSWLTVSITVREHINSGSAYEKDRRQREQSSHRASHLAKNFFDFHFFFLHVIFIFMKSVQN